MPATFPSFLPDELIYSARARYIQHMRFGNVRGIIEESFGVKNATAVLDLPSGLELFIHSLPLGHSYTIDYLISNHTHLPLYALFLEPSRLKQVRQDMASTNGGSIHTRIGLMASRIPANKYFQFCVRCNQEDLENYGEVYWHRLHQVAGVHICPKHLIWLEQSHFEIHNNSNRYRYISAEQAIHIAPPRYTNLGHKLDGVLTTIAREVEWLLNCELDPQGPMKLHTAYMRRLAAIGLITPNGRIRIQELLEMFKAFYSHEILASLSCELDPEVNENWLVRLLRNKKAAFSPIQHLLVIQFLGCTVAELLSKQNEEMVFGAGPWPCLNPTCIHYQQPVIQQCSLQWYRANCEATGTFTCSCGFSYQRKWPQESQSKTHKPYRVIQYGKVWDDTLISLTNDSTLSLRATAKRLGVDPATVKTQKDRVLREDASNQTSDREDADKSARHKAIWIEARLQYSELSKTALREVIPAVYAWLYRHDRQWLNNNSPSRKEPVRNDNRVDWNALDSRLAQEAIEAATNMRSETTRPKQITVASLARAIGEVARIQKHPAKLPKTVAMLNTLAESREEFAVRRIEWTKAHFREHGVFPSKWQFIKFAGIERLLENPFVSNALQSALDSFQVNNHE